MLVFRAHPGKATKTNQDQLGELIKSLAPDDNDISFRYGCKGVDEEGLTNNSNVTVIHVYVAAGTEADFISKMSTRGGFQGGSIQDVLDGKLPTLAFLLCSHTSIRFEKFPRGITTNTDSKGVLVIAAQLVTDYEAAIRVDHTAISLA